MSKTEWKSMLQEFYLHPLCISTKISISCSHIAGQIASFREERFASRGDVRQGVTQKRLPRTCILATFSSLPRIGLPVLWLKCRICVRSCGTLTAHISRGVYMRAGFSACVRWNSLSPHICHIVETSSSTANSYGASSPRRHSNYFIIHGWNSQESRDIGLISRELVLACFLPDRLACRQGRATFSLQTELPSPST